MNYSKGDWQVQINGGLWVRLTGAYAIAEVLTTNEGDAHLIAAAVNACQKVNLDNPIAAAAAISDMYEALLPALGSLMVFDTKEHTWVKPIMNNIQKTLNKAKAEGR